MQQSDEDLKKYLARKQWHRELAEGQDKAERIYEESIKGKRLAKYDTTREDYDSWE